MRALSVVRYHHFSYLVIGTAMLGFGMSGTFLSFFQPRMERRFAAWMIGSYTLFLLSIPLCYLPALLIPVDTQYLLLSFRQQLLMASCNLLLLLPFFFGAVVVGAVISRFKRRVASLYAADLLGSGTGGVICLVMMFIVPAAELPVKLVLPAFAGLIFLVFSFRSNSPPAVKSFASLMAVIGGAAAVLFLFIHPKVQPDQYKALAGFARLEEQGDAVHLVQEPGPRAQIDVFDSDKVHQTLFSGPQSEVLPPPQLSILLDGMTAGSVFKVNDISETSILDFTPQSLP